MKPIGTEIATPHAYNALMSLAATYAQHSRWGIALDCVARAVRVAAALRHPEAHMNALAFEALIVEARDAEADLRSLGGKGVRS